MVSACAKPPHLLPGGGPVGITAKLAVTARPTAQHVSLPQAPAPTLQPPRGATAKSASAAAAADTDDDDDDDKLEGRTGPKTGDPPKLPLAWHRARPAREKRRTKVPPLPRARRCAAAAAPRCCASSSSSSPPPVTILPPLSRGRADERGTHLAQGGGQPPPGRPRTACGRAWPGGQRPKSTAVCGCAAEAKVRGEGVDCDKLNVRLPLQAECERPSGLPPLVSRDALPRVCVCSRGSLLGPTTGRRML